VLRALAEPPAKVTAFIASLRTVVGSPPIWDGVNDRGMRWTRIACEDERDSNRASLHRENRAASGCPVTKSAGHQEPRAKLCHPWLESAARLFLVR
jgi:hypothetical protein